MAPVFDDDDDVGVVVGEGVPEEEEEEVVVVDEREAVCGVDAGPVVAVVCVGFAVDSGAEKFR